ETLREVADPASITAMTPSSELDGQSRARGLVWRRRGAVGLDRCRVGCKSSGNNGRSLIFSSARPTVRWFHCVYIVLPMPTDHAMHSVFERILDLVSSGRMIPDVNQCAYF
ncbi:hypothetical protein LSAT2_013945, partial [Lamellibrachia satsuma]